MKIKTKNRLISFILILSLLIINGTSVNAIIPPEDAVPLHKVETFNVVSKNTLTGNISIKEFDTNITTTALNKGITTLSTPSYSGMDPIIVNNEPTAQPKAIIGADNRVRISNPKNTHPYRAICRVVAYWDKNKDGEIDSTVTVGTGFLEGPRAVVTAGHAIYDSEKKIWCKYAKVSFAQDGPTNKPYGTQKSTTIHTSQAWIDSGDWNQDWAVIEVDSDIGKKTGWFGKKWTSASLNGTSVTVAGYPGDIATSINDKNDSTVPNKGKYMWRCKGSITNSLSARLEYNVDTWSGESGGPVYNSSNQVIAINTYGVGTTKTGGTRITEWLYNFLVQFQK